MGLFSRSSDVTVAVSPDVVTPRKTVQVTVTAPSPITKVLSAHLDWGYTNFFRYHWAGRADSAAAAGNDTWLTADQVGTNYGGERDTDEWVSVIRVDVPIAASEFTGTTATFKVPSWAPGSSDSLARWSCRLVIERDGRDVDARGDFTVVIGSGDVMGDDAVPELVAGDGSTQIHLALATVLCRAGEPIHGQATLVPQKDCPDGDLAVCWQRHRDSHPLTRAAAMGGAMDGPMLTLGKGIPLRAGAPITIPFALPLPADAAPSGTAVHSTVRWFVAARLSYAGFNAFMTERVGYPITVYNAP